jgi:hypothetical protein
VETTVPAGTEEAPIRITLTPHPGVIVDPKLIERCLAFTLRCSGGSCCRAAAPAATASPP